MMRIQDIGAASYLLYFNLMPQTTSPAGVVDRYGGDSQPNKGESAAHTVVAGNREEGKSVYPTWRCKAEVCQE